MDYEEVATEPIQADGPCAVDPATFNGRTERPRGLPFQRGLSIDKWLDLNMAGIGGKFVNGNPSSEGKIEFYLDENALRVDLRGRRRGAIDARLKAATAQFVVAGSYGMFHATIGLWLGTPSHTNVTNMAFDLRSSCLPDLATNDEAAIKLAAAEHSYQRKADTTLKDPCAGGAVCSQQEWASYWTKVFRHFNNSQPDYIPEKDGLSVATRWGIEKYNAQ